MAELEAGQFILWKISLQQLDGLTWKGKASFVFKASYGGRDMFSDAVSCDYKPGPVALQAKYVFKDSKGSDAVGVELFNGTPGDAASLVGKLDIDLREFRKANASSDAWIPVAGTAAKVKLGITCTVCADDDDEQASCMDAPGQEGKGEQCICQ
mmetsp:Transcript_29747/g.101134  ORF Transcript_29747/g.101134 Transcript_29747/m.101134 type:complete len:154 (-) Transcript_29747:73-534(-)